MILCLPIIAIFYYTSTLRETCDSSMGEFVVMFLFNLQKKENHRKKKAKRQTKCLAWDTHIARIPSLSTHFLYDSFRVCSLYF